MENGEKKRGELDEKGKETDGRMRKTNSGGGGESQIVVRVEEIGERNRREWRRSR